MATQHDYVSLGSLVARVRTVRSVLQFAGFQYVRGPELKKTIVSLVFGAQIWATLAATNKIFNFLAEVSIVYYVGFSEKEDTGEIAVLYYQ